MEYEEMADALAILNPSDEFFVEEDYNDGVGMPMFIRTSARPETFRELVLPEGYYYNKKNGITNKHVDDGSYNSFMLVHYDGSDYYFDE